MNFVLPENRDKLFKHVYEQYYIEDIISNRNIPIKIQDAKLVLLRSNGKEIDKFFNIFFSIIYKFHEQGTQLRVLCWNILVKGSEGYANIVGKALAEQIASDKGFEDRIRKIYLNGLKMYVYLIVEMMKEFQKLSMQTTGLMTTPMKGKRQSKAKVSDNIGVDWERECQHGFQLLMNFMDLDIHRLWDSQIVEDELISIVSNISFKIMEDPGLMKSKPLKTVLFHLLGCIIKKHKQSLSTSLKLIQMLQHFEHTALPITEAVYLWVDTYKCKTIIAEILREVNNIPEAVLLRDGASTRTICLFVLEVGKLLPSDFLTNISLLLHRMEEETYQMRSAVLGVMGEIIVHCLSKEGLDLKARSTRDQFLDIIYDHANLDVNAFVRSKAVNIFISLVKERCLPIKRLSDIVELSVRLLLDRSNLVRKATVQLLEGLLRCNPFAATLPIVELQQKREEAEHKLLDLQQKHADELPQAAMEKTGSEFDENVSNTLPVDGEIVSEESTSQPLNKEPTEIEKQKSVVTYYLESVQFVEKFQEAVPVLCQLLRSRTSTDVIESIRFFTTAWEFKMSLAAIGIAEMLSQIWNEDAKIRESIVCTYRDLYLKQQSTLSTTVAGQFTDNLIMLVVSSKGGKLSAAQALVCEMQKSGDLPRGFVEILWERLARPPSDFTIVKGISELQQQKVITTIIAMLAHGTPDIIKPKLDLLVEIGLRESISYDGSRQIFDFELAHNTCVALSKLEAKKTIAGKYQKPYRVPNDHPAITKICDLVVKGCDKESKTWIRFALQGIGVIFQLAAHPIKVSTSLINRIKLTMSPHLNKQADGVGSSSSSSMQHELLTRLFQIYGECALKLLIFIDGDVQAELKQRRKLQEEHDEKEKKKRKKRRTLIKSPDKNESIGNIEEDMGVGGATVDDEDQDFLKNILETEVVAPGTLLGDVTELVVRSSMTAVTPGDIFGVRMQQSATLALAKFMLVSSEFCERHLQIFFTILETSPHEGVRANLIIAAGDLCVRFPNLLEPWTSRIYGRLNDTSTMVRIYGIKVLTSLILNDMIKVKGYVSEMARCTVDENERIAMLAKRFFQELSKKGNAVYNVMPDIISRLSDPEVGEVDEVDFKSIMRFLFEYIQKDRQTESLVEKLCHRFKATRVVQQWRDLAFCLSLLNFPERATKRLVENYQFYCETLRDEQVYYSFNNILGKCKKLAKPETKNQIEELEGKIIDAHTQGMSEDESTARAAQASRQYKIPQSPNPSLTGVRRTTKKKKIKTRSNKRRNDVSDDDNDDVDDDSPGRREPRVPRRATKKTVLNFSSDDELDDDVKENVCDIILDPNESPSTPIRRVKTPKRSPMRSVLRA